MTPLPVCDRGGMRASVGRRWNVGDKPIVMTGESARANALRGEAG